MKNWYNKLHNWLTKIAETKWAPGVLFLTAFADASFLPLPSTTVFVIILLLNTERVFRYVVFVTFGTWLAPSPGIYSDILHG